MKNNHVLSLLIAIILAPVISSAQNNPIEPVVSKHEIGFSMGIYPVIGILDPARSSLRHHDLHLNVGCDTIDSWLIGAFTFHYFYNITRFHAVGVHSTLAFRHSTVLPNENPYQEPVSPLIKTLKREQQPYNSLNAYWTLQASYRITFKRYAFCSLYSAVSAGFTLYMMDNHWKSDPVILPSGHITALGISLGKDNNANIELGFGTQGILKVGYSRRF